MNEFELIQSLHNYNESELFYMDYQNARKDPKAFKRFLSDLDVQACVSKHLVIPTLRRGRDPLTPASPPLRMTAWRRAGRLPQPQCVHWGSSLWEGANARPLRPQAP